MIAYHVAYWEYLGWKDPFQDTRWGDRQTELVKAQELKNRFTPMLVVDGQVMQADGSFKVRDLTKDTVKAQLEKSPAVKLTASVAHDGGKVRVTGTWQSLNEAANGGDIYCALTESGLVTPCQAGENEGKTLKEDGVVRDLQAGPNVAASNATFEFEFATQESWKSENMHVVVFAQDPETKRTFDCLEVPVVVPETP